MYILCERDNNDDDDYDDNDVERNLISFSVHVLCVYFDQQKPGRARAKRVEKKRKRKMFQLFSICFISHPPPPPLSTSIYLSIYLSIHFCRTMNIHIAVVLALYCLLKHNFSFSHSIFYFIFFFWAK
jgi:hypothetical protein